MCVGCAVPVRGVAIGAECLAVALGPDVPEPAPPGRAPGELARLGTRAAFGVAVIATALPWSRFGAGSGPFGAWSDSPRWSMVVAVAAVVGLLVTVTSVVTRASGTASDGLAVVLAGVVVVGTGLAIAWPPSFTSPWLGPWVALGAGTFAFVAGIVALRGARERNPAHV
jgi:hypothetical protein